jgi:NAD(P)-dependent dehydrogenase (short-subunit alcohol dehydrogenase family)
MSTPGKLILQSLPQIDVLINNAADCVYQTPLARDEARWHDPFEVNVLSALALTQALTPKMRPGSHVVHFSSVTAPFLSPANLLRTLSNQLFENHRRPLKATRDRCPGLDRFRQAFWGCRPVDGRLRDWCNGAMKNNVSAAARTLTVFGWYLVGVAAGLMLLPNLLLGPLGFAPVVDVWVRVVGMLALIIGVYYLIAAKHAVEPLIRASVPVRMGVVLVLGAFVALRLAPPTLIGFGVVDVAAALWTARALAAARNE